MRRCRFDDPKPTTRFRVKKRFVPGCGCGGGEGEPALNGGEKPNQESSVKLPDGMTVKAPTRDISGQRFGRLVAIDVVGKAKNNSLIWRCICDCGTEVNRRSSGLREGKGVSSCGCYLAERGKDHLSTNTWNKGKTYALKPDGAVYANRKAWAKAVRRARGEACERCGWDEAQCDVHHRVPRHQGGENTIGNGIVLCPNCHRVEHQRLIAANDNRPRHHEEEAA